jgi:ribose-phosphate pyrophosphokinase
MSSPDYLLIAGTAATSLAQRVAGELCVTPTPCNIERFPDGELSVEIGASVRRREVVIIQPT